MKTVEDIALGAIIEWDRRFPKEHIPVADISALAKIFETEIKNARIDGIVAYANIIGTSDDPVIKKLTEKVSP
jgi:hypothetical protein